VVNSQFLIALCTLAHIHLSEDFNKLLQSSVRKE